MKKGRVCTRGRAFGAVVCTRTPTQHLHMPAGAPPSRFAAPSAWLALYFAQAQWLFSERLSFLFFLQYVPRSFRARLLLYAVRPFLCPDPGKDCFFGKLCKGNVKSCPFPLAFVRNCHYTCKGIVSFL